MSGTVIAGWVRTAKGEPVAEAAVYISRAPTEVPDIAALTDEMGRFLLAAPAPGRYVLESLATGYAPGSVTAEVVGNEPSVEVELRLGRLREE